MKNNNKRILLASPRMMGNEEKYVKEAFRTNWIAPLGPFVNKLEEKFKKIYRIYYTQYYIYNLFINYK